MDRRVKIYLFTGTLALALVATAVTIPLLFDVGTKTASPPRPSSVAQQPRSTPPLRLGENPPDLSTMSPREAADRLFNRVMAASERGDTEEARRFAPMAVMAYDRVRDLDLDGFYHLGLLHLVLDEFDAARARALAIKRAVPNHLLATTLEHAVAMGIGDTETAKRAVNSFNAAYQGELLTNRREYTAHRNSIESFRASVAPSR